MLNSKEANRTIRKSDEKLIGFSLCALCGILNKIERRYSLCVLCVKSLKYDYLLTYIMTIID